MIPSRRLAASILALSATALVGSALPGLTTPAANAAETTTTYTGTARYDCGQVFGGIKRYADLTLTVDLPSELEPGQAVDATQASFSLDLGSFYYDWRTNWEVNQPNSSVPVSAVHAITLGWLGTSGGGVSEEFEGASTAESDVQDVGATPDPAIFDLPGILPEFVAPDEGDAVEISMPRFNLLHRFFYADSTQTEFEYPCESLDADGNGTPDPVTLFEVPLASETDPGGGDGEGEEETDPGADPDYRDVSTRVVYSCVPSGSDVRVQIPVDIAARVPTSVGPGSRVRVPFDLTLTLPEMVREILASFGDGYNRYVGYSDNVEMNVEVGESTTAYRLPVCAVTADPVLGIDRDRGRDHLYPHRRSRRRGERHGRRDLSAPRRPDRAPAGGHRRSDRVHRERAALPGRQRHPALRDPRVRSGRLRHLDPRHPHGRRPGEDDRRRPRDRGLPRAGHPEHDRRGQQRPDGPRRHDRLVQRQLEHHREREPRRRTDRERHPPRRRHPGGRGRRAGRGERPAGLVRHHGRGVVLHDDGLRAGFWWPIALGAAAGLGLLLHHRRSARRALLA